MKFWELFAVVFGSFLVILLIALGSQWIKYTYPKPCDLECQLKGVNYGRMD